MKHKLTFVGTEDCPVPNAVRAILLLSERSGASEGDTYVALSIAFPTMTGEAIVGLMRRTDNRRIPDGQPFNLTLEVSCPRKSNSKT